MAGRWEGGKKQNILYLSIMFPTSSACWVLFSYWRAQSVCSKENRRQAWKSSNLHQENLPGTHSECTRYNFSVLLQNWHFQRFSPVNCLVLIMFLSHPETTKFIEKTNFWYERGRVSSPRRLSTIFLISASRLFFWKDPGSHKSWNSLLLSIL